MVLVVGDSHSYLYGDVAPEMAPEVAHRWVGPVTMHRVGREGFFSVCPKEEAAGHGAVLLVFGEIDCRAHVYLQQLKGRAPEEVLDELASSFVRTLREAKDALGGSVQFWIRGVVPPLRGGRHSELGVDTHSLDPADFPVRGALHERVAWRLRMNELLQAKAAEAGLGFLPSPAWAEDPADHTMRWDCSDGHIHIANRPELRRRAVEDLLAAVSQTPSPRGASSA